MQMSRLLERLMLQEGFPIQDMSSASNPGAWVHLADYQRIVIVLLAAPGTDGGTTGDNVVLSLLQATSSGGAGSKAITASAPAYYSKMAATNTEAVGQYTATATPGSVVTIVHTLAADDMVLAVELSTDDLDRANNFSWVSGSVAQLTSSRRGYLLYLLGDSNFPSAPDQLLSPLV